MAKFVATIQRLWQQPNIMASLDPRQFVLLMSSDYSQQDNHTSHLDLQTLESLHYSEIRSKEELQNNSFWVPLSQQRHLSFLTPSFEAEVSEL